MRGRGERVREVGVLVLCLAAVAAVFATLWLLPAEMAGSVFLVAVVAGAIKVVVRPSPDQRTRTLVLAGLVALGVVALALDLIVDGTHADDRHAITEVAFIVTFGAPLARRAWARRTAERVGGQAPCFPLSRAAGSRTSRRAP